jgi:superfamily II DNA/RNA helicase
VIDVLICTDAAAEGLNLQAASVIINVDMPWNPAKIEQRIGRVDRLGQKANVVNVYNIWYPDSIEARMYKIIFDRVSLYKLVVGPAQDIIGTALKKALSTDARQIQLEQIVKEVTTVLNNEEQNLVKQQGLSRGISWDGKSTDDSKLMQLIEKFAMMACDSLDIQIEKKDNKLFFNTEGELHDLERWNGAALEIGQSNLLTPSHPIIKVLAEKISMFENYDHKIHDFSLYSVKDHNGLADLVYIKDGVAAETRNGKKAISLLENLLGSVQ